MREVCGSDELFLGVPGTSGVIHLLDRLLVEFPETNTAIVPAKSIATADRDRILSVIYKDLFDDRIGGSIPCSFCGSLFDVDFSLDGLIAHLDATNEKENIEILDGGEYLLNNKIRFRLPTGEDESLTWGLESKEAEKILLERCLLDGSRGAEAAQIQQAIQQVAPLVSADLSVSCPECGCEQSLHFDIQSFLLSSLNHERKLLAGEVHRLAVTYGWSHHEILELPRSMRRQYVALILSEFETS